MGTETASERYTDIDLWSTQSAVDAMFEGQVSAAAAVRPALPNITKAADAAAKKLLAGGTLLYAGAGTSGRIAVQDGVELGPTYGWSADRLGFLLAGGADALMKSAEGAEDDEGEAADALESHNVGPKDVLIGVAASGQTPFTVAAVKGANQRGAMTIGVANNAPSALLEHAHIGIAVETGAEVIAGSTRMNAGTAQKIVLNLLSSAIMIRCGGVYKGRMVDMVISNIKLRKRAVDMIEELAGVSHAAAAAALLTSGDDIKAGVLCALGAEIGTAQALLARADGNLRLAIGAWRSSTVTE